MVGLWAHGHAVLFGTSEPDVPKDATTHIELVAHLLTRLEKSGICLRDTEFTLQTDNTTRESKNSIMLGFLCSLVSKGSSSCMKACNLLPNPSLVSCHV